METAITTGDPDRWARYLLPRGQEVEAEEDEPASRRPKAAAPPALEDGKAYGNGADDDGWNELFEGLDGEEVSSGSSGLAGSPGAPADFGAAAERNPSGQSDDLATRLCNVDVSEVFSPPRVGKEALKFGLEVGDAMDLTTGWDFNKEEDRTKAEELIEQQKPLVLIGSPPCVAFSQLQTMIPDSDRKRRQLAEGIRHMEFMAKLYRKQVEGGRVFLHENPAHAKSWGLPCIRRLMRDLGGVCGRGRSMHVRPEEWGNNKSQLMLAKKPTRFMTNSQVLGRELNRKCDKSHEHQPLLDGRTKDAARYPPGLCRAICRGISKEKMLRACGITPMVSIREGVRLDNIDPEENHEREEVDIEALIRKIEGQAQAERCDQLANLRGSGYGCIRATGPSPRR